MSVIQPISFLFGEVPSLPVLVPEDVTDWEVTGGPGKFVEIEMKRSGHRERWYCKADGGYLVPSVRVQARPEGGSDDC